MVKEASTTKLHLDFAKQYPAQILIAEDDSVNQHVIKQMLKKLGYTADLVNNGLEAVESIRKNAYDLVLMDMQMPQMDGLEATKKIRLNNKMLDVAKKKLVIIALTANITPGDEQLCLNAGMDDYLIKPLKINELIQILKKWIITTENLPVDDAAFNA